MAKKMKTLEFKAKRAVDTGDGYGTVADYDALRVTISYADGAADKPFGLVARVHVKIDGEEAHNKSLYLDDVLTAEEIAALKAMLDKAQTAAEDAVATDLGYV